MGRARRVTRALFGTATVAALLSATACDEGAHGPPSGATPDAADPTADAPGTPDEVGVGDPDEAPWILGRPLPAVPQEEGDAALGRDILLNGNYMSCGIPWSLWADPVYGPIVGSSFGASDDIPFIEGRHGHNADLPYELNAFTAADGTEVVNRNCLGCHAGYFDGELVLGLGNATADFTGASVDDTASIPSSFLDRLPIDAKERAHLDKMFRTARALGSTMQMRTVGQNPAEQLTFALLVHHDPETLAWSDTPFYEPVPPTDADGRVIEDAILTSDPPPWWRAKKKSALFYNGMSRGQHRGTMALATAVCVDDLEEARRVDRLFLDMHTFVRTLKAPVYPRPIDRMLAAEGRVIFEDTCAGCHGTYADDPLDDDSDRYPNLGPRARITVEVAHAQDDERQERAEPEAHEQPPARDRIDPRGVDAPEGEARGHDPDPRDQRVEHEGHRPLRTEEPDGTTLVQDEPELAVVRQVRPRAHLDRIEQVVERDHRDAERADGDERQVDERGQDDHRDAERPDHLQHREERRVERPEGAEADQRDLEQDEPQPARDEEAAQLAAALARELEVRGGACQEHEDRGAEVGDPARHEERGRGRLEVGRVVAEAVVDEGAHVVEDHHHHDDAAHEVDRLEAPLRRGREPAARILEGDARYVVRR